MTAIIYFIFDAAVFSGTSSQMPSRKVSLYIIRGWAVERLDWRKISHFPLSYLSYHFNIGPTCAAPSKIVLYERHIFNLVASDLLNLRHATSSIGPVPGFSLQGSPHLESTIYATILNRPLSSICKDRLIVRFISILIRSLLLSPPWFSSAFFPKFP